MCFQLAMIPAGYMYKRVAIRPDWLEAEAVRDIYSLSNCVSNDFTDYINYWKHNGYWLFNSPETIEKISADELFYYEVHEYEYNDESSQWISFAPEPSFGTDVRAPANKHLEGFDVTTFYAHTSPEHSPLSCNSLASEIPVNEHCLFNTFQEEKEAIERGLFKDSEHGPYRIYSVYTVKGRIGL